MNERAKQYIREHSDCTYEDLVGELNFEELTKAHFFSMKTQLRKKGLISGESRAKRGRKPNSVLGITKQYPKEPRSMPMTQNKTIEILESIDVTEFSEEIREHYKNHFIPMLKRLMPNGERIQMVMLSDPPTIELRRTVIR